MLDSAHGNEIIYASMLSCSQELGLSENAPCLYHPGALLAGPVGWQAAQMHPTGAEVLPRSASAPWIPGLQ